jgi:proline iminopeptidase
VYMLLGVAAAGLLLSCSPSKAGQDTGSPVATAEEGFFPGADGIRLFYRKVGAGPTAAIYLHGGPWSMADGGYEWDALADGVTLIAFDQRSGGHSQLVGDAALLTPEHFVRDLDALRQHFGIARMTLIGQSWGAMLAAMYAARYPATVERLVFISPGPPSHSPYWPQRLAKTNAVIGEAGVLRAAELGRQIAVAPDGQVAALCKERMAIIFRVYLNDAGALERMRVGYCDGTSESIRHELAAGAAVFQALGEWDLLPDLAKLQQPALVLEGADTQVPLEATRAWAAALPNGRLLLVPGASHILFLEGDVPKTAQLLKRFLAGGWPEEAEVVRK